MMNDLSLLIYTNQKYLPIAKLAIDQMNKYFANFKVPKFITSNSFDSEIDLTNNNFDLLETNIPFSEGSTHFSPVLISALEKIDSEYVMLFLEDYFVINEVKEQTIFNLVTIMKENKIDYLSLMAYEYQNWEPLKINYKEYGLPQNILRKFDYAYLYMFSVQPSIWKKESLISILKHNPTVSVHDFDTTRIKNKKGKLRESHNNIYWETPNDFWDYDFNFVCFERTYLTKNYAFDEREIQGDYLTFLYSEVIRWGRFNLNTHHNNRIFLENFLKEKNITKDSELYKQFF